MQPMAERSVGQKRKGIDETFHRMFEYPWGTEFFRIDPTRASRNHKALMEIFGMARASRILGTHTSKLFTTTTTATTVKKRKLADDSTDEMDVNGTLSTSTPTPTTIIKESLPVNPSPGSIAPMTQENSTALLLHHPTPIESNKTAIQEELPSSSLTQPTISKIDDVLKRLAGPSKTSTVQKTNDDWESFKESDKQFQEDLEKQAQGKDAFLVRQDFLLRVDNRKFELEKDARDKERAKRMTQG